MSALSLSRSVRSADAAALSRSTICTCATPREAASNPRAPLPANRSSTVLSANSPPHKWVSQLNSVSRTRSGVGRKVSTSGTTMGVRLYWPPTIRIYLLPMFSRFFEKSSARRAGFSPAPPPEPAMNAVPRGGSYTPPAIPAPAPQPQPEAPVPAPAQVPAQAQAPAQAPAQVPAQVQAPAGSAQAQAPAQEFRPRPRFKLRPRSRHRPRFKPRPRLRHPFRLRRQSRRPQLRPPPPRRRFASPSFRPPRRRRLPRFPRPWRPSPFPRPSPRRPRRRPGCRG